MSINSALLKNFLSSSWGKLSMLIIRVIQVPVMISALGAKNYGFWLVISSLPSWLSISNMGFGSVASNEMVLSVSSGDNNTAKEVFSTSLTLVFFITIIGSILVSVIIPWVSFNQFVEYGNIIELKYCVVFLSLSVFISFSSEIYGGRLRAAHKAHQAMLLASLRNWIDFFILLIVLSFTKRFDYLALAILITTILDMALICFISRYALPSVRFSFKNINFHDVKPLFKKGLAFQAFPLGNALLFQGNILVVQYIIGPLAVVLFSTLRTLVRTINQLMEMINQVIWPELSLAFGSNNLKKAAQLHRLGVAISLAISIVSVFILSFVGLPLYQMWTGKTMQLNQSLLICFLLPIPFNALWYTSSVVHVACNKHEGLAIRYLISCFFGLLSCAILSYFIGITGAAISTIVADFIVIPYVFSKSLTLTHDTFKDFRERLVLDSKFIVNKILVLNKFKS
ncbi:MAG: lipopolysaccharide biosynthesis protein [Flavobacterium sp.]|nr:lipopolysaccharide biosynthesis protein [Flavobacterium sp.]